MANKWYGRVGYVRSVEDPPGVWKDIPTELPYYGDITRNNARFQSEDRINDNLIMNQEIRIVGDPFAYSNFQYMRYAEVLGTWWSISSVQIAYPRIVLEIGKPYSGITVRAMNEQTQSS